VEDMVGDRVAVAPRELLRSRPLDDIDEGAGATHHEIGLYLSMQLSYALQRVDSSWSPNWSARQTSSAMSSVGSPRRRRTCDR